MYVSSNMGLDAQGLEKSPPPPKQESSEEASSSDAGESAAQLLGAAGSLRTK